MIDAAMLARRCFHTPLLRAAAMIMPFANAAATTVVVAIATRRAPRRRAFIADCSRAITLMAPHAV